MFEDTDKAKELGVPVIDEAEFLRMGKGEERSGR